MKLEHFGWYLPAFLLASGVAGASLTTEGFDEVRIFFYAAAFVSLWFGLASLVRSGREMWRVRGRGPSAVTVAFTWQTIALAMIFFGILGLLVTDIPRAILVGLLTSGCSAIVAVNYVLFVLGKRRQASRPVDPGPLRPLFRRKVKR